MQFNGREIEISVWKNEYLGKLIAVDTETTFQPFHTTPELCTVQVYGGGSTAYFIPLNKLRLFFNVHYESTTVWHNFAFDADVLSTHLGRDFSYDLIDRNKVKDTSILYRLYHLGTKGFIPFKYNLALLTDIFCNEVLNKDNDIRCTFDQYLNKPIEDIPQEHLEYGALDAIGTFDVYLALSSRIAGIDKLGTQLSHDIQVKGDLALLHIHKNGIGFSLEERDKWMLNMKPKLEAQADILASWGWVRGLKGINDRYEQIVTMIGIAEKLPKTDSGIISSKSDDLEPFKKLPFVNAFLKFHEYEKAIGFVKNITSSRIHPRYNLLANTGRTTCSGASSGACNIQQIPRVGGIREQFIPDKGNVLLDIDYSSLELATLAQVNIKETGYSKMAELINEGKCLHYYTASNVYRKPESDVTKDERQFSKIPNFAFPTNMSPNTFIEYCAGYDVDMTLDQAIELKEAYAKTYPEISKSFWKVPYGENNSVTLTGRIRANCSYTAYLNCKFQGLAADGFKLAMYEVDKAGYKIVAEIHDQLVIEHSKKGAENALKDIEDIMVKNMRVVVPDVKITTEGQILDRWCK